MPLIGANAHLYNVNFWQRSALKNGSLRKAEIVNSGFAHGYAQALRHECAENLANLEPRKQLDLERRLKHLGAEWSI
jgi:hypothetical protein